MIKTNLKTTITLCLLGCILSAQAQSYLGLRGGVNFANVPTTEDGGITKERIAGAIAGLYFDVKVNDKIAIQPEFNYVQKGFVRVVGKPFHYVYRLNYLEWNVLFKYRISNINNSVKKKKRINAYLLAGPYYGWAFSGKRKNRVLDTTDDEVFHFVKRGDTGLIGGGGIERPMGVGGNLIIDIRYNFGILPIDDWNLYDGKIKNHGILITVGYAFQLGR